MKEREKEKVRERKRDRKTRGPRERETNIHSPFKHRAGRYLV